MTAIAGIAKNGNVWIGGDSAGVAGYSLRVRKDPKVFEVGPFLIGYTSSFRMGQVLRFGAEGKTLCEKSLLYGCEEMDGYEFLVTRFVPWVRERFKAAGFAEKHYEAERGGAFLVGFRGGLYEVASDYQIAEYPDGLGACGCGSDLVLGSLATTQDSDDPENRISVALGIAERFSAGVRGPFTVLCQKA